MANLYERVTEYPVVNDSIKAASNAYTWFTSGERFKSVFQLSEQAANMFKEKAKSMATTDAVTKMDELACTHILDRMESVFPLVKSPTEEVFGSVADRALTAAESYLEYFMPHAKLTIDGETPAVSRYDRLIRIQSALLQSEKVQAAQTTLVVVYKKLQDSCTSLLSAASKENRDAMLANIATLTTEYQASAAIAFPKFKNFIDGAVSQTQIFVSEFRNTENVSQFAVEQMRTTLNGLHNTLSNLNERREAWVKGFTSESQHDGQEMKEMKKNN